MQISALYQDLIKELVSELTSQNMREINLSDLLTARVKAIDGDNVLLRLNGRDIPAKTLIPLEIGETFTFQFQGTQDGKAILRLINNNLSQKEPEFISSVLKSFDLPDTTTSREIIKQIITQQLPLNKKDVIQIGNLVKNFNIPTEDIESAIFLSRQAIPSTPENITLFKEFQSEGINIFQGLDKLESLVTNSQNLPLALKDEIILLLNKITSIEISPQDSGKVVQTKLNKAPSFIFNQVEGKPLTTTNLENNTPPKPANIPDIIITEEQEALKEQGAPKLNIQPKVNGEPVVTLDNRQFANTPDEVEIEDRTLQIYKENILNRLEFLAGKSIEDHNKLNSFLLGIRETLQPGKEEIQEMINKLSARLDNTKPEEHAIKEVLKDLSNRFDFVDRLVQKVPIDNSQQIVFYSQVFLKDDNNHQTPMTITIKQSKDQKDKKINFDNCTLSISLQTQNLSLVKANVKKSARQLSCQLFVDNETAKNTLEPFLPELAETLEKLNFSVSIKPVIVETLAKKENSTVVQDLSSNLFNIDIRI